MSADQSQPAAGVPAAVPAPASTAQEVSADQGIKVFAGNLAYSTDDAALRAFFAPVDSDIVSVQIIMRGHRSAGYGFVAVKDQAAANTAVSELDKKELDGRQVIVEIAKPNDQKPRVRSDKRPKRKTGGRRGDKAVPGEVTEAEANGEAAPAARIDDAPAAGETTGGEGAGPAKPRKKKFNKKRKAKARSVDDATAPAGDAAQVNGHAESAPEGTEKRIRKPRGPRNHPRVPREPREAPTGPLSKTVLFVANLAFNVDEEALTKAFSDAGIAVTSARVVRRRWGTPRRSKGYGFVDVGSEQEQEKAMLAIQGKELEGRPITVKVAVDADRENQPDEGAASGDAAPAAV